MLNPSPKQAMLPYFSNVNHANRNAPFINSLWIRLVESYSDSKALPEQAASRCAHGEATPIIEGKDTEEVRSIDAECCTQIQAASCCRHLATKFVAFAFPFFSAAAVQTDGESLRHASQELKND
eukprot:6448553-Amphidinium_carterae.1